MSKNKFTEAPLTVAQRLDNFDPARHGGEVMAGQAMVTEHFVQNIPPPSVPLPGGEGKKISSLWRKRLGRGNTDQVKP